jgi:hypothetical protein
MGAEVTEPTTQELLERIRQLEAVVASGQRDSSPGPEPPKSGTSLQFSDLEAQIVQVAGRDMTVYELKRNFEFLESFDRAHRTRRLFFWLSALSLIATLAAATYALIQINDLVWSSSGEYNGDYRNAFRNNNDIAVAVAIGAIGQVVAVAFFIMGLFSRSPSRYR